MAYYHIMLRLNGSNNSIFNIPSTLFVQTSRGNESITITPMVRLSPEIHATGYFRQANSGVWLKTISMMGIEMFRIHMPNEIMIYDSPRRVLATIDAIYHDQCMQIVTRLSYAAQLEEVSNRDISDYIGWASLAEMYHEFGRFGLPWPNLIVNVSSPRCQIMEQQVGYNWKFAAMEEIILSFVGMLRRELEAHQNLVWGKKPKTGKG